MQLYSGPLSLFSAKVRVALAEKGITYECIEVGWSLERRYEPHHPEVVRLNPKRQVPVLVDGDLAVYDSTQIFEYLEERCPSPPLYPAGLAERARCRRLEAFGDEILFPELWKLIDGGFYPKPADAASAQRIEEARSNLSALQHQLDAELAEREYLCDRYSVADIGNFVMLSTAARLGAPPPAALSRLGAWLARVGQRRAVRQDLEAMTKYVQSLPRPGAVAAS